MTYTIISYGAGEVLEATFNAIAALINSKTGTLYNPLVRFALLIGLMSMVIENSPTLVIENSPT
jgi:hypothetical protein